MTALAHPSASLASDFALRLTQSIELVCALPGVATPHWCECAAQAILPLTHAADHPDPPLQRSAEEAGAAFVCLASRAMDSDTQLRAGEVGVAGLGAAQGQAFLAHRLSRLLTGGQALIPPPLRRLRSCEVSGCDVHVASLAPEAARDRADRLEPDDAHPFREAWVGAGASRVVAALVELDASPPGSSLLIELGVRPSQSPSVSVPESALASAACAAARRAAVAFGPSGRANGERITIREEEVLDLLIHGLSVQEIARKFCRSPHTIHDHVKSLHRKVGASSRGELVARALGSNGANPPEARDSR